ncbi:transglutaminase superfamily protein [Natranaerovirga hydrolytica]|uniref:Transglutaminase superfamily protein n=1 Tax=Natranaerovirga hydrolytica TaxID=680378 RepID=A0A4R1N486_9FIRM|nr:transglutaminase-like domain-containing protein [Natranaerovirga hydrolytica]TCK97739.1 transglutaminase superfamily protein [Natranaerovirga hydrolytica]
MLLKNKIKSKHNLIGYLITDYLLAISIVYTLVYGFGISAGYDMSYYEVILMISILFMIARILFWNKKMAIIALLILIVLGVVAYFLIEHILGLYDFSDRAIQYYFDIYISLDGFLHIEREMQMIILSLIAFIFSVLVQVLWRKHNQYYWLLLITSVYFFVLWHMNPFGYYGRRNVLLYFFIMIVTYFWYYLKKIDGIETKVIKFLLTGVVVSYTIVFSANALYGYYPDPFSLFREPEQQGMVEKEGEESTYESFEAGEHQFIDTRSSHINNVPSFSGEDIGMVKARQKVYLRGATFNTFNDAIWSNHLFEEKIKNVETIVGIDYLVDEDDEDHEPLEEMKNTFVDIEMSNYYEGLFNMARYMEDYELESLLESNENPAYYNDPIRIFQENHFNNVLLIPFNLRDFRYQTHYNLEGLYYTQGEIPILEERLRDNFIYTVNTFIPNYNDETIEGILRESYRGLYKDNDATEYYIRNSDKIYENHLQLPKDFNLSIKALAKDITAHTNNQYDQAKAIESYLKDNYTYTLEPNFNENTIDPISKFLFQEKQGYCTSFATSMALMLRSLDIPTRYVIGYVASEPISGQNPEYDSLNQSFFRIKDYNAHAWVEVYFEGFGWVPFEPTSGFVYQEEVIYENNIETQGENLHNWRNYLYYIGYLIMAFVFLRPFYLKAKRYKKLKAMNSKEEFVSYYQLIFVLMNVLGIHKGQHITLAQFAKENNGILSIEPFSFQKITDIYETIYYGNVSVEKEDLKDIKNFYKALKKKTRKNGKMLKYLWYGYNQKIY